MLLNAEFGGFPSLLLSLIPAVPLHRLQAYRSSKLYCSTVLDGNVCSSPRDSDCICCRNTTRNIFSELKPSGLSVEMSCVVPLQTLCTYKVFPSLFSLILTLMFPFSLASSSRVERRLRSLCPEYHGVMGSERGCGFPSFCPVLYDVFKVW